jgi:NAD(P)-dependent dehydrogenase (short-subunit alcohol dehydrogenase family)
MNNVAVVTGAAKGIGLAIAERLAKDGAKLVLADLDQAGLKEASARLVLQFETEVASHAGDLSDQGVAEKTIKMASERFGRLDILVNNAQTYRHALLLDATEEDMDTTWRSGPLAVFRSMRLAHPYLKQRGGVIVNFGSGAQLMHDGRLYSVYAAAKSAIESLTRYAAVEWGPDGIRALVVMPAARSAGVEAFERRDPARYEEMVGRVPLGRFGDAEHDIGRAIAWLVSDDAGYITGSTIMLDGGQMFMR